MNYEIGETVVHQTHGLGTVIGIDQMNLAGKTQQYYVVKVDTSISGCPWKKPTWVQFACQRKVSILKVLFDILRTPGKGCLKNNTSARSISANGCKKARRRVCVMSSVT